MEGILSEIRLFAGKLAPVNWEFCSGQVLEIGDAEALFHLMGAKHGGDGERTFALPNLPAPLPGMHYIICVYGVYPST